MCVEHEKSEDEVAIAEETDPKKSKEVISWQNRYCFQTIHPLISAKVSYNTFQ
jgi:hypothetical protein